MSWYSDGEKFDEFDPEWCETCRGSESKAQCDACCKMHTAVADDEEPEEELAELPPIYEEFLKKAHKRRKGENNALQRGCYNN